MYSLLMSLLFRVGSVTGGSHRDINWEIRSGVTAGIDKKLPSKEKEAKQPVLVKRIRGTKPKSVVKRVTGGQQCKKEFELFPVPAREGVKTELLLSLQITTRQARKLKQLLVHEREYVVVQGPEGQRYVFFHWSEGSTASPSLNQQIKDAQWLVCCHPEALTHSQHKHLTPGHTGPLGAQISYYGFYKRGWRRKKKQQIVIDVMSIQ